MPQRCCNRPISLVALLALLVLASNATVVPIDLFFIFANGTALPVLQNGVLTSQAAALSFGPHDHPVSFQWQNTGSDTLSYTLVQDYVVSAPTSPATELDVGSDGGASAVFADLPLSGTVPQVATKFNASHACTESVEGKLQWLFQVSNSTGTQITVDPIKISFPWTCAKPGCDATCGTSQSSFCDELAGQCVCTGEHWTGYGCSFMLIIPLQVCPGTDIPVTLSIPTAPSHTEWYDFQTVDYNPLEWRYVEAGDWSGGGEDTTAPYEKSWSFLAPLDPQTFRFGFYPDDYASSVGETSVEVLPWTKCGYAECQQNSDCLGDDSKCDTSVSPHVCVCGRNRAGGNCSHGCPESLTLTTSSGTIHSDFGGGGVQASSFYYYQIGCQWIVDVGQDAIRLEFDWIDIAMGDTLRLLDEKGEELISWGAGVSLPQPLEVDGGSLKLKFQTDGINLGHGFSLRYSGVKKPLPAGAVAGIAAGSVVVGIAALASLVWLAVFMYRRKKAEKLRAATVPAEIWTAAETEAPQAPLTFADIEQLGVSINRDYLFVMGKETFPVRDEQRTNILISNQSGGPVDVTFYVPAKNHAFEMGVVPGKFTLGTSKAMSVQASFTLLYSTSINQKIKVVVKSGRKEAVGFIGISFVGAISTYLDPDAIMVETKQLGSGSFGAVYKGSFRDRPTAVKVLWNQALTARELKAFNDEISMLTQLHSPYIMDFFGAVHVPGRLCLCFELLPLGDLAQYVADYEIPFHLQIAFAENIAQALSYLHNHNIVYRDLKSGNILVHSVSSSTQIKCKLGDLGSARPVENVKEFMNHPSFAGTMIYTAPEVLLARPYNNKVDVYGFGLVMWEISTGEKPWSAVELSQVFGLVTGGERPDMAHEALDKTSTEYRTIMEKCWAQDPSERPEFESLIPHLQRMYSESKTKEKPSRRTDTTGSSARDAPTDYLAGSGSDRSTSGQIYQDDTLFYLLMNNYIVATDFNRTDSIEMFPDQDNFLQERSLEPVIAGY